MNPVTPLVRGSVFRRIHLTESRWSSFPSYRPPLMLYSWAYSSDSPSGLPVVTLPSKVSDILPVPFAVLRKVRFTSRAFRVVSGRTGDPKPTQCGEGAGEAGERSDASEASPDRPKGEGGPNRPTQRGGR